MKLSDHFNLEEFLFSETAARQGTPIVPTAEATANLTRLVTTVLEPARTRLGKPFVVTSGYRPIWLNEQVGGSTTSAHVEGRAADIKIVGMTPGEFFKWIRKHTDLPIDQVINEFEAWVHIGIAKPGITPRWQFLIASKVNGKTQYEELK
jgi:zinc D-Ala-D-Ala carboxypeptidase